MRIKGALRGLLALAALGLAAAPARAATQIDLSDEFGGHYQTVLSAAPSGRIFARLMNESYEPSTHTTAVEFEIRVFRQSDFALVPFDISYNDGASFTSGVMSVIGATVTAGNLVSNH